MHSGSTRRKAHGLARPPVGLTHGDRLILKLVGSGTNRESSDKGFEHILGGALAAIVVGGAILFAHTFGLTLPI